jgi:glycosyltransferase involved in cell wall biosynthesis
MQQPPTQQHVLFLVNAYPPSMGGVQRHVSGLASELVTQGHRATVITLSKNPSERFEDGVRVIRLQRFLSIGSVISFPSIWEMRQQLAKLAGEDITAVSTHTRFFPMTWWGHQFANSLAVPSIHTEHGSDYVRGVSLSIGIASRLIDETLGRIALRRASRVLGVSQEVVTFVKRLSGRNATIFFNAIPPLDSDKQGLKLSNQSRFIFVGRIVPGKGWDRLLSAIEILQRHESRPNFRVEIIGTGPDLSTMRNRIKRLNLSKIVTVLGQRKPEEVLALLANATLVNPTTLSEGFQTTLLEALAADAQIVTYLVPGAELLASRGAPVRIVSHLTDADLAKGLMESITHPMAPCSAEEMASWTWPVRARQYISIIESTKALS